MTAEDIIKRLEAGKTGSKLDIEIAKLIHSYPSGEIPNYTTSIDAKLPWEGELGFKIEQCIHIRGNKIDQWSVECWPRDGWKGVFAVAPTEAAARRAAALKAHVMKEGR